MPAYAYAIQIKPKKQVVTFNEEREFQSNSLTLSDLAFVGDDPFSVHEHEWSGYTISVARTRLETDEERDTRVARERAYMEEYTRRQTAKVKK